jgi:hypothetical protein
MRVNRMQGRVLEVPIVITLGLAGIAWLTAVSPRLGLAMAAVVAAAVAGLFVRTGLHRRGLRGQSRRRLDQASAEHGMALWVRQEGRIDIDGGMLGLDRSMRKLAFATPGAARVARFDAVRSVSVGTATALGQSTPGWYSIDLAVEGHQERLSVATTRRRQARKWLDQLGEALGEDRVRDARATLG